MTEQPITVTINNKDYNYYEASEALTDGGFIYMRDTCSYQDTGGGWRSTYKTLRELIEEHKRTGYEVESVDVFPKIYIKTWYY